MTYQDLEGMADELETFFPALTSIDPHRDKADAILTFSDGVTVRIPLSGIDADHPEESLREIIGELLEQERVRERG